MPPEVAAPAADRVATLFNELWNDSQLGPAVRRKAKTMYPDVTIPEDQTDPIIATVNSELEAIRKERAEWDAQKKAQEELMATAQARAALEAQIGSARDKFSLTDDGMAKMLDRMKTTGNYSDAEAAAAWVAQQTPQPRAAPAWLPQDLNLFGTKDGSDERFKLLHHDPQAYMDAELQTFVQNPDAYVAAA